MAITVKMRVGMAGWMSARAATVVDSVPPTLDTSEEEPTPAALTVVGINSPVHDILRNIPTRTYKLILILDRIDSRSESSTFHMNKPFYFFTRTLHL